MVSLNTSVRAVAVLGMTITLFLSGCSSLRLGGYQGEPYQIVPPSESSIATPSPWETDTSTYHTVVQGETLASIAQRYGRNWQDLAQWNNLRTPYTLDVGQRILISGRGGAMTSPIATDSDEVISQTPVYPPNPNKVSTSPRRGGGQYVVQPGDTVYSLARKSGHSVSELMMWNGLSRSESLQVGQSFWLSPPNSSQTVTVSPGYRIIKSVPVANAATSGEYHVVVSGDTLYNVARRYGYTSQQLAAMNGLSPPYTLALGSTLQVGSGGSRTLKRMNIADNPPSNDRQYHTVSSGQTAYSIAKMYGCTTAQLLGKNGLRSPTLRNKQRLNVSGCSNRSSSDSQSFLAQSVSKPKEHLVKQNETLEGIAKLYGVTSHELALWNGIGSPYSVYPGHRLVINPR